MVRDCISGDLNEGDKITNTMNMPNSKEPKSNLM